MADGKDYAVGYGKPPPEHRFKKGKSGNPRGRKPKRHSEADIIARVRDERIAIVLNGRRTLVSPFEAAVRKCLQTALTTGGSRDLERLIAMFNKYGAPPAEDLYAQHCLEGEAVVQKLFEYFEKTVPDDEPGG